MTHDPKPATRLRRLMLRNVVRILRSLVLRLPALAAPREDREADRQGYVLHRGYRLPPRSLRGRMCGDAFRTDSFYFLSAVLEATKLRAELGYTPGARIVDIGSGLGRLATGILAELGAADYFGIDAHEGFVRWCREHIEQHHPTFRFLHLDMANALYNPGGTLGASDLRLPVDDGAADIVVLWGVFTNMVPEHVQAYVGETGRVLRPGGRCFLTAFAEDGVPDVTFNPTGYVPYACNEPLEVVRYNRQWLFSTFRQHGLQVEEFRHHGSLFPRQSEIYLVKAAT